MVADFRDNMQKCQEYMQALEEERRKIQVFQRELPLCLELVTQEQTTSSDGPVLEEFIPLKRSHSPDDDDDEHQEHESNKEHTNIPQDSNENDENSDKLGKKSDWLRSVQLWNQTPDPPITHEEHQPKRVSVVEVKKSGEISVAHKKTNSKHAHHHYTTTSIRGGWRHMGPSSYPGVCSRGSRRRNSHSGSLHHRLYARGSSGGPTTPVAASKEGQAAIEPIAVRRKRKP
ncbi:hypothetical protein Cgig2_025151 [Carnegiea gigantea]|uniref:HHO5-like N-terminal domain-containing protein n=1 Tax=Carnegiea gigantea TaxID=171969 RepID=A0A9Q1QN03_9CARY|nr:hypothetical protein Cgig2_025151 [Carnegiea gigantea]